MNEKGQWRIIAEKPDGSLSHPEQGMIVADTGRVPHDAISNSMRDTTKKATWYLLRETLKKDGRYEVDRIVRAQIQPHAKEIHIKKLGPSEEEFLLERVHAAAEEQSVRATPAKNTVYWH